VTARPRLDALESQAAESHSAVDAQLNNAAALSAPPRCQYSAMAGREAIAIGGGSGGGAHTFMSGTIRRPRSGLNGSAAHAGTGGSVVGVMHSNPMDRAGSCDGAASARLDRCRNRLI